MPVVSATFTTLGAFIPLLFWPGIIGKFMSYLPIIVIVVMCASLLSALMFMPIIGAHHRAARTSTRSRRQGRHRDVPRQVRPEEGRRLHRHLRPADVAAYCTIRC